MELTLEEIEAQINKMTPKQRAEVVAKTAAIRAANPWFPQPGPQSDAYYSKADELLYGGAAGGGKTELILGLATCEHERSLIFRAQSTDLDGLWARLQEIMAKRPKDVENSVKKLMKSGGRTIEGGHLDKPGSERNWQGRPHDLICVQRGTRVVMGDRSLKPVEDVSVGDMVATLEGPRAVRRVFKPRTKEGGRLTAFDSTGCVVAAQVQSANHAVLQVGRGRSASPRLSSTSSPSAISCVRTAFARSSRIHERVARTLANLREGLLHTLGLSAVYPGAGSGCLSATYAYAAPPALGTSCAATGGAFRGASQRRVWSALRARPQPAALSGGEGRSAPRFASAYGTPGALRTSLPVSSTGCCSSDIHPCGEHTRVFWGSCAAEGGGLLCLHRPNDAALPNPRNSATGGPEETPIHSRHTGTYAHPYTKATRQATEAVQILSYAWEPLGVVGDLFDMEVEEVNHYITEGGIVNKNCFDEAAQLDEMKVNFVTQWLRSTTPGQRQRVVMATNPPMPEIGNDGVLTDTGTGDWLMRWFAPWVDDTYPNPAEHGELRWCFMVREGDRLRTVWVDGPGAYDAVTHELLATHTQDDIDNGRVIIAKSRTFIKSLLKNNIFLRGTGYAEKLSTTPEPLKSMLLLGDFTVKGEDHPMQVIPTQYVLLAQQRWHERQHEIRAHLHQQLVLFGDIAQGGADTTVLASLLETDYYEELITRAGRETPTGAEVMAMILLARRDGSILGLDATGGWAGSTAAMLENHHNIVPELHVASHASSMWMPDMSYRYANIRTEDWWEFRLALDPKSEYEICLPPSTRLRAQLTTPHFKFKGKLLYIESKDEIRTRLQGSSTDEADAVIGAWSYRDQALAARVRYKPSLIDRVVHGITPEKLRQQASMPVELEDPLSSW